MNHRKLFLASDGEFLSGHTLFHRIVDEAYVMLNETLVGIKHILSGRKVIVGIRPVNQLVEMNMLTHESYPGKRVAVRAGERVLHRADVVVVKMGYQRIIQILFARKLRHKMLHIERLPLTRFLSVVRMLCVLCLCVISRIDHHRGSVRHHDQRRVTSSSCDRVDVQIPFLPFRKILRSLCENIKSTRKHCQCQ